VFFSFLKRRTELFDTPYESIEEMTKVNYEKHFEKSKEKEEREKRKKDKQNKEKAKERRSSAGKIRELTEEEYMKIKKEEVRKEQEKERAEDEIKRKKRAEDEKEDLVPEDYGGKFPCPGNGNITDKYSWTQLKVTDVNIRIFIDPSIHGKDLNVKITRKTLFVSIRKTGEVILEGEFPDFINLDTIVWHCDQEKTQKVLNIFFEKKDDKTWWPYLLKGEEELDIKKCVPEPTTLSRVKDDDTRRDADKVIYDTLRKQQGLPTSDKQKEYDILEKFAKKNPEHFVSQNFIEGEKRRKKQMDGWGS